MKPIITFRTEQRNRGKLIEKASSLGMTVSDLLDNILTEYLEKDESWITAEISDRIHKASQIGVVLKIKLTVMNSLVSEINAARKNKITWPVQADDLLALIRSTYRSIH